MNKEINAVLKKAGLNDAAAAKLQKPEILAELKAALCADHQCTCHDADDLGRDPMIQGLNQARREGWNGCF